jgi:hypothetical protein
VKTILLFIRGLIISFAELTIEIFNGISRNYRLVAAKLSKDMEREKQNVQVSNKVIRDELWGEDFTNVIYFRYKYNLIFMTIIICVCACVDVPMCAVINGCA